MSDIPNDFNSGPRPEFHMVHSPNSLLSFLQHDKKVIAKIVDSWPLKISFVLEFTYDSVVIIDGHWMNTMELLEIVDLTKEFNMLDANYCHITYIQAPPDEHYEVVVLFDKVDGDGISFSHN
jgi:hypothetical protein